MCNPAKVHEIIHGNKYRLKHNPLQKTQHCNIDTMCTWAKPLTLTTYRYVSSYNVICMYVSFNVNICTFLNIHFTHKHISCTLDPGWNIPVLNSCFSLRLKLVSFWICLSKDYNTTTASISSGYGLIIFW